MAKSQQDGGQKDALSSLKKVKRGTNSEIEVMALILEENQMLKQRVLDLIRRTRSERIAFGKESALNPTKKVDANKEKRDEKAK